MRMHLNCRVHFLVLSQCTRKYNTPKISASHPSLKFIRPVYNDHAYVYLLGKEKARLPKLILVASSSGTRHYENRTWSGKLIV